MWNIFLYLYFVSQSEDVCVCECLAEQVGLPAGSLFYFEAFCEQNDCNYKQYNHIINK